MLDIDDGDSRYKLYETADLMKQIIFLLILIFTTPLMSANHDADEFLANALYETEDYRQSRQIYENLLKGNPPHWEKDALIYNIGSLLIHEKKLEEALVKLKEISHSPNPLVRKRALANIAIIQFFEARNLAEFIGKKDLALSEEYHKGIFLFRESLKTVKEAQKASCDLEIIKGKKTCEANFELVELKKMIKEQYALFLEKFVQNQMAHLNLNDGIPLLLRSINEAQMDLNFLQNKTLTEKIKKDYQAYYLQREKKRLFYWEILKGRIKESSDEEQKLFSESENTFKHFIQMMEKENYSEAETSLNQTKKTLNTLMREIFGKEPLAVNLQKLLASYKLAMLQDPLQETTLLGLQNEQKEMKETLTAEKGEVFSELKEIFNSAEKNLSIALESLRNSKAIEARMFTEEAQHLIKIMTRQFEPLTRHAAKQILEWGIEDQEWALRLNRLNQQLDNPNATGDTHALLVESQSFVLKTVHNFAEELIKQQQHDFENSQCQDRPWDEVVPLFDHGVQDAKQVQELLNQTPPTSRTAIPLQERVIKSWREALQLMIKPKKSKKEEEKPQEQPQAPEPESLSDDKLNQTLHQLQEMEQDDRSKPNFNTGTHKQDLKPW